MKSIKLLCLLMGLPALVLADPFLSPPVNPGDLPIGFGNTQRPVVREEIPISLKGVKDIRWAAYCKRVPGTDQMQKRCRVPTWYVVTIPNPDENKLMEVDLYDIGL